ncbi:MAG TPA: aminoglycoside phosphotransferase family protein [Acidimicrobiia bacterium]|jgi:hypothetical protein|nr:aminoglycoside phosphotransferase family protein [Acidimicrobiia bacterium]
MDRLPHGYTNFTRLVDAQVEKTYDGPRRWANSARELACLVGLAGQLPVAIVVDQDLSVPRLSLSLLPGRHGQELIDEGHASKVLRLAGEALVALQGVPPDTVPDLVGEGSVIVHGDFGPQNMLFDLNADRVTGVLDWESAHIGSPIEDLAWSEWIVRMHHPEAIDALDAIFEAAQQRPPWAQRQRAMLQQIEGLIEYCESAGMDRSAADWRIRLHRTKTWTVD